MIAALRGLDGGGIVKERLVVADVLHRGDQLEAILAGGRHDREVGGVEHGGLEAVDAGLLHGEHQRRDVDGSDRGAVVEIADLEADRFGAGDEVLLGDD